MEMDMFRFAFFCLVAMGSGCRCALAAGDVNPTRASERGVRSPILGEPARPGSLDWQLYTLTASTAATLFDWVAKQLK
jgi:hypothetical protein